MSVAMMENNLENIIIAGDLNTDFSCLHSTHTKLLLEFLESESMTAGYFLPISHCDYTFESKANHCRSVLDHILFSSSLVNYVTKYAVHHDGDNLSDHSLLVAELNEHMIPTQEKEDVIHLSKLLWDKASKDAIEMYRSTLDIFLDSIVIPWDAIKCTDLLCCHNDHVSQINNFHNDIVNTCLSAGKETIPHCKKKGDKCKIIPGWKEYVEPEREKCLFWHKIWKDNGSPRNGLLADIRLTTRAKYHCVINIYTSCMNENVQQTRI